MHQEAIQEGQYVLPYHHLPYESGEAWQIFRTMPWGYEYLALLDKVTSIVKELNPQTVLDFGCGDGRLVHELSQLGIAQVVGVDISERAIDFAKAIVRHPNTEFHTSLDSVTDSQFDLITSVEVIEHIPDSEIPGVFAQMRERLKSDGSLLISVPTTNLPLNAKHYRHYTVEVLKEQTEGLFEVHNVEYLGKQGFANWLTRKMLLNRFVIPKWRPWLQLTTKTYKRYALKADAMTGAHLIALLKKTEKERPNDGTN